MQAIIHLDIAPYHHHSRPSTHKLARAGLEPSDVTGDCGGTSASEAPAGGAQSGARGAPKADLERLAAGLSKLDPERRRRLLADLERGED